MPRACRRPVLTTVTELARARAATPTAFEDKNLAKRTDLLAHFINSMSEAGTKPDVGYLRDMLMDRPVQHGGAR